MYNVLGGGDRAASLISGSSTAVIARNLLNKLFSSSSIHAWEEKICVLAVYQHEKH